MTEDLSLGLVCPLLGNGEAREAARSEGCVWMSS